MVIEFLSCGFWGNAEVANVLLKAGANPDIKDKEGHTALFWANLRSDMNMYDLLIKSGAQPLKR